MNIITDLVAAIWLLSIKGMSIIWNMVIWSIRTEIMWMNTKLKSIKRIPINALMAPKDIQKTTFTDQIAGMKRFRMEITSIIWLTAICTIRMTAIVMIMGA